MDQDRFQSLIEAYGGPDRWPPEERAAAERYAAELPQAAKALRAAQVLDEALDAWKPMAPSAALRDRVLAAAPPAAAVRPPWRIRPMWWSGAGLAAACAAGVLIGAGANAAGLVGRFDADRESAALSQALDGSGLFGAPSDVGQGG